jgi:biopolymer transport protein ExbB
VFIFLRKAVFEIIKSGGWMMLPIILCSIASMAITIERFWSLQRRKVLPPDLVPQVWKLYREQKMTATALKQLKSSSPLGCILAADLINSHHGNNKSTGIL